MTLSVRPRSQSVPANALPVPTEVHPACANGGESCLCLRRCWRRCSVRSVKPVSAMDGDVIEYQSQVRRTARRARGAKVWRREACAEHARPGAFPGRAAAGRRQLCEPSVRPASSAARAAWTPTWCRAARSLAPAYSPVIRCRNDLSPQFKESRLLPPQRPPMSRQHPSRRRTSRTRLL